MKFIVTLLILSCNFYSIKASDTLTKKPRFILDFAYSHGNIGTANYNYQITNKFGSVSDDDFKLKSSFILNAFYLLTPKLKSKHQFYVGFGLQYSQAQLKKTLYNHTTSKTLSTQEYVTYSKNEFDFNINLFAFSPQIVHHVYLKHLVVSNRFGLRFSEFSSNKSYSSQKYTFRSQTTTDPNLITPSNPNGSVTTIQKLSSENIITDFTENSNRIFYNCQIGYRFKKFLPSLGIEYTILGNAFNNRIFQIKTGIAVLL